MTLPENWHFNIGRRLHDEMKEFERQQLSELAHDLPGSGVLSVNGRHDDDIAIIQWKVNGPGFILSFGTLNKGVFDHVKSLCGNYRNFSELYNIVELKGYYSHSSFIMVADVVDGELNVDQFLQQSEDWYNTVCLPRAENLNSLRVRRAIPAPPLWDVDSIVRACWVVESDEGISQGTAFALSGIGLVTCAHVVSRDGSLVYSDLSFFDPRLPHLRHSPDLISINKHIDIAVFDFPEGIFRLDADESSDTSIHSHIAVCGYPNFIPGKGCVVSPGVVISYSMKNGIRRLVTNAGIVAGMSGGPAITNGSQVVGVCATGALRHSDLIDTDEQCLIPVSAIKLII